MPDTERRRYDDACGTAFALDLVGDRWALLVVRELMFGPRRFGELRGGLPGISANVLTQRLGHLDDMGVLIRRKLPPPASVQVYELTAWGHESERAIQELGRWAARSPRHDPTLPISAASVMMSFRTMFDAARAMGLTLRIGFRFGDDSYLAVVENRQLDVRRAEIENADVVLETEPGAVVAATYGDVPLDVLAAQGALRVEGDPSAFARFACLFALPQKVGAA